MNDLAAFEMEPLGVMLKSNVLKFALRNMKARQLTIALKQRGHRLLAADIFALDIVAFCQQGLDQLFNRESVAGMHFEHIIFNRQNFGDFALQLGGQGFQQRREARADAVARPNQLFGQRRKV